MRYYFLLLFGVTSTTLNVVNPNIQIWQDDDPLAGIDIKPDTVEIPYDRDSYSYGIDADKDGQDTRAELLLKSSITIVSFKDAKKHIVSSGKWFDPYTGVTFTNADHVDIDHLVPLYEVHLSGGAFWSNEKKRAFSNDISVGGPLRITHRWTNRIPKGADDPTEYSPSYVPGRCAYLNDWIAIKRKWGLSMDKNEAEAIRKQLKACA